MSPKSWPFFRAALPPPAVRPSKIYPCSPCCTPGFTRHRKDGTNLFTLECVFERREAPWYFTSLFPLDRKWEKESPLYFVLFILSSLTSCLQRFSCFLLSTKPERWACPLSLVHYLPIQTFWLSKRLLMEKIQAFSLSWLVDSVKQLEAQDRFSSCLLLVN